MRAADDVLSALRGGRRGAWERFWFGEGSLVRLALFRIVVVLVAFYALEFHRPSLLQGVAATAAEGAAVEGPAGAVVERRYVPVYFLEVLGIGPLTRSVVEGLHAALTVLLGLALLGFMTRTACALAAVGMWVWIGSAYSIGQPHHEYGTLAFALAALPFGPVGARLSLDALRARRRMARGLDSEDGLLPALPAVAEGALLPIRFVQVTLAISYVFAGASKLALGGSDWLNGYTLQGILLEFHAPWSEAVAGHLGLLRVLSWGVILIQFAALGAVLWRPLRWWVVPAIVAMHLGSRQTMETGTFFALWALLAAFVDGERVPGFLRARLRGGPRVLRVLWASAALLVAAGLVVAYLERGPWLALAVAGAWLGWAARWETARTRARTGVAAEDSPRGVPRDGPPAPGPRLREQTL